MISDPMEAISTKTDSEWHLVEEESKRAHHLIAFLAVIPLSATHTITVRKAAEGIVR